MNISKLSASKFVIVIFVLTVLFQLIISFHTISLRNEVMKKGKHLILKTMPVDPYDAFRGKYIHLNYDLTRVNKVESSEKLRRRQNQIYVTFKKDSTGYSIIDKVSLMKPEDNMFYLEAIGYHNTSMGTDSVAVSLLNKRFYMEEFKAEKAEKKYLQAHRNKKDAFVTMKIYKGKGIIENLFIEGKNISDYISNEKNN